MNHNYSAVDELFSAMGATTENKTKIRVWCNEPLRAQGRYALGLFFQLCVGSSSLWHRKTYWRDLFSVKNTKDNFPLQVPRASTPFNERRASQTFDAIWKIQELRTRSGVVSTIYCSSNIAWRIKFFTRFKSKNRASHHPLCINAWRTWSIKAFE